jgi:type II secretory pathway pseudopilin PulG
MNGECRMMSGELKGGTRHSAFRIPHSPLRAFTLIEMTVVIAIIILLAGLVVPAATQMWRDRKIADAQNLITGMLMTARALAIQSGGAETGLFFFVDDQGVQRVVPITQNPNDPNQTVLPNHEWQSDPRWYNVFTVARDRSFTLPGPMRAVPIYAVCGENDKEGICKDPLESAPTPRKPFQRFSEDELKNNDFANVVIGSTTQVAQAHRNFFTIVFSPDGELRVSRPVYIRDVDEDKEANSNKGAASGLRVGVAPDNPGVAKFYSYDESNSAGQFQPAIPSLVTDNTGTAIVFPPVDGLLVYDDSLFNEAGDAAKMRKYLLESALPFYFNRITGAVVRGPTGEAPIATP